MSRVLVILISAIAFFSAVQTSIAVQPDEILDDPVLEQRARDISANLRCLVCQNESIDNSNADLAKTLRVIVRERLVAGDADDEVISYLVDRYGEFVLLKPVFGAHTLLLWLSGPIIFLFGGFLIWRMLRGQTKQLEQNDDLNDPTSQTDRKLSAEEEEKLKKILEQ